MPLEIAKENYHVIGAISGVIRSILDRPFLTQRLFRDALPTVKKPIGDGMDEHSYLILV